MRIEISVMDSMFCFFHRCVAKRNSFVNEGGRPAAGIDRRRIHSRPRPASERQLQNLSYGDPAREAVASAAEAGKEAPIPPAARRSAAVRRSLSRPRCWSADQSGWRFRRFGRAFQSRVLRARFGRLSQKQNSSGLLSPGAENCFGVCLSGAGYSSPKIAAGVEISHSTAGAFRFRASFGRPGKAFQSAVVQAGACSQEFLRIDGFPVDPCFIMQVRPR